MKFCLQQCPQKKCHHTREFYLQQCPQKKYHHTRAWQQNYICTTLIQFFRYNNFLNTLMPSHLNILSYMHSNLCEAHDIHDVYHLFFIFYLLKNGYTPVFIVFESLFLYLKVEVLLLKWFNCKEPWAENITILLSLFSSIWHVNYCTGSRMKRYCKIDQLQ